MILFAMVVIAGAYVLRRLGIVAEPPDAYRFQAPTPTLEQGKSDPSLARQRAQKRMLSSDVPWALLMRKRKPVMSPGQQIIDGLYTIEQGLDRRRRRIHHRLDSVSMTGVHRVIAWR